MDQDTSTNIKKEDSLGVDAATDSVLYESEISSPIVDNNTMLEHYQQNDGSQNYAGSVPVFNGSLDIAGSVVFEGPFVVNGDTTMDGSVVIRPTDTDTQIITGNDKTQNSQFNEGYNNRLNHREGGNPHSFSIRSGPASILASGTVIAFGDNPVEIIFGSDSTRLVIMFSDEPNPQNVQARLIDENIIEFTFFKSQDQFEYIGTLNPLPLGIWQNQQLYVHCRLREFLGGDIAIDFGIYLVERDS